MLQALSEDRLRRRRGERGALFIETLIILPVFLLLVFGVIQFGLLLSAHITVRNASAVAVREAILEGTDNDDVITAARDALRPMLDDSIMSDIELVNVNRTCQVNGYDATCVTVNYDFPLMFSWVVPGQNLDTITLTSISVMR